MMSVAASPEPAASLGAWLRSRSDAALVGLLQARPDLVVPVPSDLEVVAARAVGRPSLLRALEDLDRFALEVLAAVVLVSDGVGGLPPEERAEGVPVDAVVALVEPEVAAPVRATVEVLRRRALLWDGPGGVLPAPGLAVLLPTHLSGLGRPAAVLRDVVEPESPGAEAAAALAADPQALAAAVAACDDEECAVLQDLAERGALGTLPGATDPEPEAAADDPDEAPGAPRRLLARGLLVAVGQDLVEMPREVGLLLRGDRPLGTLHPEPPEVPTRPVPGGEPGRASDDATAQAATAVASAVEGLGELWGREPAPVLRAGGLGVRELRRLARAVDLPEATAGLLAEVAAGAGLVLESRGVEPHWTPTPAFDAWRDKELAERWAALVAAWLELPRLPGLAGAPAEGGRSGPLVVLGPELVRSGAPALRREVLGVLAGLPRGQAPTASGVSERLAWQAPRRHGRARDRLVADVLAEATTLGVLGGGALSGPGRSLLDDGEAAAAMTLRPLLPEPVRELLVQPDLSLVAPGPLERDLAREVALLADVESTGTATVFRISESSVRRALDAGRTPDEVLETVRSHSRTPVPQGLEFLVRDVARRHGLLRAGPVQSYLRCDDDALLTEVVADRGTRALALRRLAPTVAVSPEPVQTLLEGLRAAGFAPVAESDQGGVVVVEREPARAVPSTRVQRRIAASRPGPAQLSRLVKELRQASRAGVPRPHPAPGPAPEATSSLGRLQAAARGKERVRLRFVDSAGRDAVRSVIPTSTGGGFVVAHDPDTGTTMTVALHRVTSVEDAPTG